MKDKIRCLDFELLTVGLRLYYVPREFSHIVIIVVYTPPQAGVAAPCDIIHLTVLRIQTQHPSAFIAITGGFNNTTLTSHLTGFVQYVDCPTREIRHWICFMQMPMMLTVPLLYHHLADQITIWSFSSPRTGLVY